MDNSISTEVTKEIRLPERTDVNAQSDRPNYPSVPNVRQRGTRQLHNQIDR